MVRRDTFIVKQKAFLKMYLITMADEDFVYGLRFLQELRERFRETGFSPTHSTVYKALHDLLDEGILGRFTKRKAGTRMQEIEIYFIKDQNKAELYKKQVKEDIDRSVSLLNMALKDNFK